MKILKGILSDSEKYYRQAQKKIRQKLSSLPRGNVKERKISGQKYYYLQQRFDKKVVHKYLGKEKPQALIQQIKLRKAMKIELKKVNEALKILKRTKGRKRD